MLHGWGEGKGFTEADSLSSFPWFLRKPEPEPGEGPHTDQPWGWKGGRRGPLLTQLATWRPTGRSEKKEKLHRSWLIVFPRTRN